MSEPHLYELPEETAAVERTSQKNTPDRMTPELDQEKPVEVSKRDKRRAKEAKRKAEEEAQQAALKEDKKAGRKAKGKGDTTAQQNEKLKKPDDFVAPKKKGKSRTTAQTEDSCTEEKAAKIVESVKQHREKMVDRWGDGWARKFLTCSLPSPADRVLTVVDFWQAIHLVYRPSQTSDLSCSQPVPGLKLLCLGLGKPYSDRSAQIQLALLLELSARLQVRSWPSHPFCLLTSVDYSRHRCLRSRQ